MQRDVEERQSQTQQDVEEPANSVASSDRQSQVQQDVVEPANSVASFDSESRPTFTLRVGDVIEYYYNSVFGEPRGLTTATVIGIDSAQEDFKLILSTGHQLLEWQKIKQVRVMQDGTLQDYNNGLFTIIKDYILVDA